MTISQDQQNLIDAYLREELTGQMKQNFETELASDKVFKKAFIFQQSLAEAIDLDSVKEAMEQARIDNLIENKSVSPELKIVQNTLSEAKTENIADRKWRRIGKLIIGGLAAACVLLAGFGGWAIHLKKDIERAMYQANILPSFESVDIQQVGGRKDVIEYKWKEAKKAYDVEDFEKTLMLLNELQEDHHYQSDELIYFQAVVYTQMDNYNGSIKLLKTIIRKKTDIEYDARWYVALVYLKTNEKSKAKEQFNILVQNSEEHQSEALKKLQKHYFL